MHARDDVKDYFVLSLVQYDEDKCDKFWLQMRVHELAKIANRSPNPPFLLRRSDTAAMFGN